ncbi:MAG: hypothetical protein Q9213_002900 [Squamulea squamosa]
MDDIPLQNLDASYKRGKKRTATKPPGLRKEQVQARYRQVQEELDKDGIPEQLAIKFESHLVNSAVHNIDRCVCTSLGSFTSTKYAEEDEQPNRPMYQLAAFETMKKSLEKYLKKTIEVVRFQDPEMNQLDISFLEARGYKVTEHPQALNEIARDVFVYTPGASYVHVRDVLHFRPAVYVGVDLERWIEAKK